jgi:hypothetical protein
MLNYCLNVVKFALFEYNFFLNATYFTKQTQFVLSTAVFKWKLFAKLSKVMRNHSESDHV